MVRTQIQLTEEQAEMLKRMATEQKVSVAEIIRRNVDAMVCLPAECSRGERWRRAMAAVGRFHSDETDVSVNHDHYLVEAYES